VGVLVVDALRNDSIVGLRNNGNEEVKKDNQVEELVEEPHYPN